MDRFIIRQAGLEDAEAIIDVNLDTWAVAYEGIIDQTFIENRRANKLKAIAAYQDRFKDPETIVFVAEVDGKVVGFANAGKERSGVYDGEIYALYVLEAYHGIGIGMALLKRVKTLFHIQGKKTLLIWSLTANPYRGFYERMGGVEVKRKTLEIGAQNLEEIGYLFSL